MLEKVNKGMNVTNLSLLRVISKSNLDNLVAIILSSKLVDFQYFFQFAEVS